MMYKEDTLQNITAEFYAKLGNISTEQELEQLRIEFLGRKGKLNELTTLLKELPLEEKRIAGPRINAIKQEITSALEAKEKELAEIKQIQANLRQSTFDVTSYKPGTLQGSLHPYTYVIQDIENVFMSMGFLIAQGPEVETDFINFEALNIPADHPARDMHDTFWLNTPNLLLRTHTSTVQIHSMTNQKPPIAIAAPGRVYRHEATDASHDFMFLQCECAFIDKNVSMANLLATTKQFLQGLFKREKMDIRVKPSFFPFVEPGIQFDMTCPFCTNGCSVCKKTRWIEIGGAGLIHPHVLKTCGIDTEEYSGFAFGFGLTRLVMLKYGIPDIRLLHNPKIEFLKQF
jgi:phenylalanyl-tRNA synthetase alpha chain